ncbi:M28 family peptidase [bacterium]|nr:M28 family peptidase [bacterium]
MIRDLRKNLLVLVVLVIVAPSWLLSAEDDRDYDEANFLSNTRQLIFDGKRSGEGYFSSDGKALIFQSEREPDNPFFQIYILDLESGEVHRVSSGIGKTTCSFFRSGSNEVLFASTHLDPDAKLRQQEEIAFRASGKERRYSWDYDEHMDIFSADRTGGSVRRLTETTGYDAEAAYSPDGQKIVFSSLRNAYQANLSSEDRKRLELDPAFFAEIYLMNADGSDQIRLTEWPGYDGGPFFTPDGNRIVWRHFEENGMLADVYMMRLDGSDIRRLTDFKAMSWAPYFHPSGEYAIFASNKLGFTNFELYLVDALGEHDPVRVTYTDGFDGLPVFSPDGQQLCWTSNRTSSKASQLFLAKWNHRAAQAAIKAAPTRKHAKVEINKFADSNAVTTDPKGNSDVPPLSASISGSDLKSMVGHLASDELEGRMTGSKGSQLAAEYITTRFKEAGLKPFGDGDSYLQKFEFTSGMKALPDRNHLEISSGDPPDLQKFKVEDDFRPLAFTTDGEIEAEVVFAGYGLKVPGGLGEGYDSYVGLNVKDKIVLVLRYVPEEVEMERRQVLNRYAGLRYKAMVAREQGAKAMLVVTGPNSPRSGELVPMAFDASGASSGIIAASITAEVAEALLAHSEKDLASVQSTLDVEDPHAEGGFLLEGTIVKLIAGVERVKKPDYNVLGLLPASASGSIEEYIVVGAHYDHIGYGEIGSMARKGEEGQIHNGADDNASGTSIVLELASALAQAQVTSPDDFKRNIVFALWSGEELGLIGSAHFVEHPPVPLNKVTAYLNFDMVGRLRENNLVLQGLGSSSVWTKLIEKRNVAAGFSLTLQEDPYLPTDATAFYPKGVPVLSFFTGSHEDYNRPTDDAETLNYQGMERITRFGKDIIMDLVQNTDRPDYVKVERTESEGGGRETLRAYLGTIPDYVEEGSRGVKLSGVRAGGPADKAGLKGGDIIIEFAGQDITNIYDYTYALDAVKIGQEVKIVVVRDGEQRTFTVVPEARK